MIHEQRTSSRFGEISDLHCRQKSWNIHCDDNYVSEYISGRQQNLFLLIFFTRYESVLFTDKHSKEIIYELSCPVLLLFLLIS